MAKIIKSCALSLILGAFGNTASMADSGKLGHVPVLDEINSSAYQYLDEQKMAEIRGSAVVIAITASVDTFVQPGQASGAAGGAAAAAASPPGELIAAYAAVSVNAANSSAAAAYAEASGRLAAALTGTLALVLR